MELAIAGRGGEIKESVVAVEVLGRAASFDPRTDPIVRVEAGRLRSRLVAYYQTEGSSDAVLVDLPIGGYMPHFHERPVPKQTPWQSKSARLPLLLAGAALFGFLLSWAAWPFRSETPRLGEPALLSVLAPEGATIEYSAISPDGRYIAFTATSHTSSQLWIRALNSIEARVLPGTDGAADPFWSPDSRSIAFFSVGMLRKISISGGPAKLICNTEGPGFGGTWSTQGVILLALRGNDIYQVSADGGTPTAISSPDVTQGEMSHLFPYFLPDGRHFLYSVISRGPLEPTLRIGSLDSQDRRSLLKADLGSAYSPPYQGRAGSIIFAYHGALMSQAFDAKRLELSGAALQIAPEVRFTGGRADFSASSNGALAYQGNSERDRQLTWMDRNGRSLGTVGPRNAWHSMNLSPDEKHVAIGLTEPSSGRSELRILDLDRGSLTPIGLDAAESWCPVWSPDGREIAFSGVSSSGMQLMRQAMENLNAAPLLALNGVRIATDWSADGKFLAYTKPIYAFNRLSVWLMPTHGSSKDPGITYSKDGRGECCAAFSPARSAWGPRWLAYASSDGTGKQELYVKELPEGKRRWRVSSDGGWLPHWRRDGRELFYLATNGTLMAVDILAGTSFAAGKPRALFDTKIHPFSYPTLPGNSYAVSSDGQRFLVNYALQPNASSSITVSLPQR